MIVLAPITSLASTRARNPPSPAVRCSGRMPTLRRLARLVGLRGGSGLDVGPALIERQLHAAAGRPDRRGGEDVHLRRPEEAGDEAVARMGVKLDRRAHLLDRTLAQDDDRVGHRHRLDLVVRPADRDALAMAARQLRRQAVEQRRDSRSGPPARSVRRSRSCRLSGRPGRSGGSRARSCADQRMDWNTIAMPRLDGRRCSAVEEDAPRGDVLEAGDHPPERRLPQQREADDTSEGARPPPSGPPRG